jgi:hypothetical protein
MFFAQARTRFDLIRFAFQCYSNRSQAYSGLRTSAARSATPEQAAMVILQVTRLAMFESVDLSSRPNWKLRIVLAVVVLVMVAAVVWLFRMTGMPLKS